MYENETTNNIKIVIKVNENEISNLMKKATLHKE